MRSVFAVVICLQVAVGAVGLCSVPFMSGLFGDCSASYVSENHFSIDLLTCALFADLNFTNSTSDSWPNITDTCIQESPDDIAMNLYHTTPSGPGRSLTAAQCQTYEQIMQCRMDCLLTFDLLIPNSEKFGYVYLIAISCNKILFTTSIGSIFNNQNNIEPTFTSKSSAETIVPMTITTISKAAPSIILLSVSSSSSFPTVTTTTSSISFSSTFTTAPILVTSQLLFWSTLSTAPTITASTQHHSSFLLFSTHSTLATICGDVEIIVSMSTVAGSVIIFALGIAVALVVVLIRHKTLIQKNSQRKNNEVIFTSPNPVYGYLSNSRGEIRVPKAIHDELETFPVCTEPVYDTAETV